VAVKTEPRLNPPAPAYTGLEIVAINAILKAEGITAQFVDFEGGAEVTTAMVGGSVDIGGTMVERPLILAEKGFGAALRTGKVIDLRHSEAATFADILDGLSPAIFLVDAGGHIVHGNAASRSMLDSGDLLRAVHNRLTFTDPQIEEALSDAIAAAASEEPCEKGSAVPLRGHTGERYVAHVLPLAGGERHKAGIASTAIAALFVRKAELATAPPSEIIGKTYKLTPTELRVLLAIVNVGGVRQVAGNLGVADTTVKTHLGRLFEKTGVSRQSDLVKLVAGFSPPLLG
jgi:DNA-binding CsgD family transcriptional regulator